MKKILLTVLFFCSLSLSAQIADKETYLSDLKNELVKKWPKNRTLNIVFHGHSVPTGYARTPIVNTLQAYPHMLLHGIKTQYPFCSSECYYNFHRRRAGRTGRKKDSRKKYLLIVLMYFL